MQNINTCTTGATQIGGSILSTPITASTIHNNVPSTILPLATQLPLGNYKSEIVSVSDAIQNDEIIGIDCVHRLTNSDGSEYLVKFRFFAPKDIQSLIDILAGYGLTGNLGSALLGLKENVTIVPRPRSAKYVHISNRNLASSTVSSSPPAKKASLASNRGHLCSKTHSSSTSSQRATLLDDDDSEFDDFLDEDDE